MRRWSASIIAAAMIFSGTDFDGIPGDGDDDGIECVEYSPAEQGNSHGTSVGSRRVDSPPTDRWHAPSLEPYAAITLNKQAAHVGVITLASDAVFAPKLLTAALRYIADRGALKAIIHVSPEIADRARETVIASGWNLWRSQLDGQMCSIEFLNDLYHGSSQKQTRSSSKDH